MRCVPDRSAELALRRRVELLARRAQETSDYLDRRTRELGYGPLPAVDGLLGDLDAEVDS